MNKRRIDKIRKNEITFVAIVLVVIAVIVAAKMDAEDRQAMSDYTCAMIADGTWPEEVADEGECGK